MIKDLALLINNAGTPAVFQNVIADMPADSDVYIIGGAIRNAIYRHYFGEELIQRDYDQIITRGSANYLDFLTSIGFKPGTINTAHQKAMTKPMVPDPVPFGYEYSVVFDMHLVDGTDVRDNLVNSVPLTINGFAISIRDVFNENWLDKVIYLPGAIDDIKNKQIRVNKEAYKSEPATIFACLRFISAGFTPPTKDELQLLVNELPNLSSERFARNLPKIFDYVGGEFAARDLVAELGIDGDIFDEKQVKSGNVKVKFN